MLNEHNLDIETHLCKSKGIYCPFYERCGFQGQKQRGIRVWFVAHASLMHVKPKVIGNVIALVIDEDVLGEFEFETMLMLDNLSIAPDLSQIKNPSMAAINLFTWRKELYKVLAALPEGPVPKAALQSFNPTIRDNEICDQCYRAEWELKVEPKIQPDMSAKQIEDALRPACANVDIKARASLWRAVRDAAKDDAPDITGRIWIKRTTKGRAIIVRGVREDFREGWRAPTLLCDATADAKLLSAIWPWLAADDQDHFDMLPMPPQVTVRQIVDRTFGKAAIVPEDGHWRRDEQIELAMTAFACAVREAKGRTLLVTHLDTELLIRSVCHLPSWFEIRHFGGVTGLDVFKDVGSLIILGRPQAPPEVVAQRAEALFGRHVPQRAYVEHDAQIPIIPDAQGNDTVAITQRHARHPDPIVDRLRRQVTEGSLIQAGGRGRAGLRTANEPLDILLMTGVPVPEFGAVQPLFWVGFRPTLDEIILATVGVSLESAVDTAKAMPTLARSAQAVKDARRGSGWKSLYEKILIEESPLTYNVTIYTYQLAGQRQRPRRALFLSGVTDDPRGWLEARLGPVARFEAVGVPAPAAAQHPGAPLVVLEGDLPDYVLEEDRGRGLSKDRDDYSVFMRRRTRPANLPPALQAKSPPRRLTHNKGRSR
jgi:hypothetical protein